jgi:putative membrane protein
METSHILHKFTGAILLGAALALGVAAYHPSSGAATTATVEAAEPLSSGEILQVLEAVNQGEIEQARLALAKSDNPHVEEVAERMIQEHMLSNERVASLAQEKSIDMQDSQLSEDMLTRAQEIRAELGELSGHEFDRVYLQHQIALHDHALHTVRTHLLPNADEQDVRELLNAVVRRLDLHRGEANESHAAVVMDGSSRG